MAWSDIGGHLKNVSAAVGAITTIWVTYQAIGLPVPATRAYVKEQIHPVTGELKSLSFIVLEGQLQSLKTRKSQLRMEQASFERLMQTASDRDHNSLMTRINGIKDEIDKINAEENEIEDRLRRMKATQSNARQQSG